MPRSIADSIRAPEQHVARLIDSLRQAHETGQLKRYITHLRFPRFKNISPNAKVEFSFPVSAFVGSNGSGKTSALHALYGAPKGRSTSDFWFATDLDPIREGDGEPHRFIYAHMLEGEPTPVETRKARTSVGRTRRRKPGYFEPTKATVGDGMDMTPFPATGHRHGQSKDRWNPVDRSLVYINFRSELSGFDKFLFWAQPKATKTFRDKHDRLQQGARRLKRAIESRAVNVNLRNKRAVYENRELSADELSCICAILGKSFAGAILVRHIYYGGRAEISVVFQLETAQYSEAFAGSGELAVVSLVVQLLAAEDYALVLLDEPEVSLHPGAQERLLIFLLEITLRKKLQVVFTTHAPQLVRWLPEDAIKVFVEGPDGTFDVVNSCLPLAAFRRLGATVPGKLLVVVEDELAKILVEAASLNLDESERSLIDVSYLPGGVDSYYSNRMPTLMHLDNPPLFLLDGDARRADFEDPDDIPASANNSLSQRIKDVTGCNAISLAMNSGESAQEVALRHRHYLRFLFERVRFLPLKCPEAVVLVAKGVDVDGFESRRCKTELRRLVENEMKADSSEMINDFSKISLRKAYANPLLTQIADTLREMLARVTH